jgi:YVTN family beta-propeller protein
VPLGDVRGRIDHLAADPARNRAFVAELGNDSLGVIDLKGLRVERTIPRLREPQGVGYDPATDTIYVANAGDGSVVLFKGDDLSQKGRLDLGSDADNVRVDSGSGRIFIGHGDGALAIVDAATHKKLGDIPLKAHPESFQIDTATSRIFINVPNARAIDVVDGTSRKAIASWPTGGRSANFAMALDHAHQRVLVAFRRPAQIAVLSMDDGKPLGTLDTCGDIDDLFVDPKRDRLYVSCGEGSLDVRDLSAPSFPRLARIATASGARTSLFLPELDRLLLAVPARAGTPAAIWIYRPMP